MTDLKIAIAAGPECPHCHEVGFDDWHHERGLKSSNGIISGRLKCHNCGKFFSIDHYLDGETHSTARTKAA